MKGVLVILDGAGDLPCKQLDGKTPFEAAHMPNLNFLATRGEMGVMDPVKPGFVPESDQAEVALFGNDLMNSTRGQLEARGADIKLTRGDLALRTNFATIDSYKAGNIKDRRAGRTLTTGEAQILAKAINKIDLPCKFIFKPTVQHRGVLVLRGGFSDNITGNDSTYSKNNATAATKIGLFRSEDDDDENAQYTVNVLNEFVEKVFHILNKHPVNEERRRKGLLPANFLLMRGAGAVPPKLKFYKKWVAMAYMPLEKGFAKTSGMKVSSFEYPPLKGIDAYVNLWTALRKACNYAPKVLKKNRKKFDYAYIHIKETDLPGHDNKPIVKKNMLEYIDKTFFKFLRRFAPPNHIKVVVTADHSTPCKLKAHSADPVPVLFYNQSIPKKKEIKISGFLRRHKEELPQTPADPDEIVKGVKFCEKTAHNGSMGRFEGKELLGKVGFLK